jgi:FkbM family methyltransferase
MFMPDVIHTLQTSLKKIRQIGGPAMSTQSIISDLLTDLNINPVLLDIGASAAPPKIWSTLAQHSTYIGFDPDLREIHEELAGAFRRSVIVNEAVISDKGANEVTFYLTASPYCSSTLEPEPVFITHWIYSNLFEVEKKTQVRANTIDSTINRLNVNHIDWIKTDSQGTDLRLFNSISPGVRSHVLAVDIEPGLVEIYKNEDLFTDVHQDFLHNGFWLSDVNVGRFIRMRRTSLYVANSIERVINDAFINETVKSSPTYLEARYFRTIEWLAENSLSRQEYALLWVFAIIDGQLGFAFDLSLEFERIFGNDDLSRRLKSNTLEILKAEFRIRQKRKSFEPIERVLKKIWRMLVRT